MHNVGSTDRLVRFVIAALAIVVGVVAGGGVGVALFVVAAIAAVTGLVGFCPLYKVIGVTTCKVRPAAKH
jgi:hypothetical protein